MAERLIDPRAQGSRVQKVQLLELLGESDHGVVLYRHLLENQIKLVAAGKDPLNTFRDPAKNIRIDLATESREKFLTGRAGTPLGMRRRYADRFKPLA